MAVRFRFTRLLLLFAMVALPLRASADPSTDAEALIAAGNTLIKRLDATGATGVPPTLSNADAELVRTAYDEQILRAMPLDLDKVSRSCISIGDSIVAYVNYADRATANAPDPVAAQEAKLDQLQNELAIGSVAANLCVQKAFRAVAGVVAGLTAEQRANLRAPLQQMRDGGAQTIAGSVASATMKNMSVANRSKMLAAVLDDLRFTAASFTPTDRRKLRDQVVSKMSGLPPTLGRQVKEIADVLAETDCNLLCQVGS